MIESLGAFGPWIVGAGGMMAGTAVVGYVWGYAQSAFCFVKDRLITNIEVQSSDPAFNYLMAWVADNHTSKFSRVQTRQRGGRIQSWEDEEEETDGKIDLVPRGVVPVKFGGKWHLAWTWQESVQGLMEKRTTLVFQGFWLTNSRFIKMAEAAKAAFEADEQGRQKIFSQNGMHWSSRPSQTRRTIESVVLAPGVWNDILSDARQHLSAGPWCAEVGIPWRRGYLLEGGPGNGKSSAIRALAGELGLPLYVLNLKAVMTDEMLNSLMSKVPAKAVVAIEDIDCLVDGRKSLGDRDGVSFSGLLNAIDGIEATEGRILVLTSNHPDQLDPALIRPGRVDRRWTIGNPTFDQARDMANRILGDCDVAADWFAEEIAGEAEAKGHSAAWVQCQAMARRNSELSEPKAAA